MISADFAPNESWDDALLSLGALLQPWAYHNGPAQKEVRTALKNILDPDGNTSSAFFLTGRAALYWYLKALNAPHGSEVLIQAFTCAAVPLPIQEAGLKPVYVDIESETYSMNIEDLRKKYTPQAKVLVLQHTFGYTPQYQKEILAFAKEHQLTVLVDLAHGFHPDTIKTYSAALPDISFLISFGRSKPFSSVFGGAIFTTDRSITPALLAVENTLPKPSAGFIIRCLLYKPLALFIKTTYDIGIGKAIHMLLNKAKLLIPEISSREKQGSYDTQYNGSYPNGLAILLIHQLHKFATTSQRRLAVARRYEKHYSYNLMGNYPVTRFPINSPDRESIMKKAAQQNIYLGKWYDQVVAPKNINLSAVQYLPGSCPTAEQLCKTVINLPLDSFVTL